VGFEIRPIVEDELMPFAKSNGTAFGWEPIPEFVNETAEVMDLGRTLAVFDGDEIVATTAIFDFDMTVPGGMALPNAGVTWVSVKPTHRRQGILTRMMQRQLNDVRERGQAWASLWASESIIYGRFGYGLAAEGVDLEIDRLRTDIAFEPARASNGRLRIVSREQALEAWPAPYDEVRANTPGMYTRSETWWEKKLMRAKEPPGGSGGGTRFYAQYEEGGRVLGYARYRVRGGGEGSAGGTVTVQELIAANDSAYASLWRYIFGVDLIATIKAHLRRVDEPLFYMLADSRRLQRRPHDSLWVRLVDVPAALEARRYSQEGRIVFDVRDPFCSWVEGRYELEAGSEGARCAPTDAEADITLNAADLGAAYLGGARLTALRRAGRVEGDWSALRRADAMFTWDPAPWCPEVF
jgi:predicted acetyltransferase